MLCPAEMAIPIRANRVKAETIEIKGCIIFKIVSPRI